MYKYQIKEQILIIIVTIISLATLCSSCSLQRGRQSWKLVWSDEFNHQGLPDTSKWNYDTVGNHFGWGNNEAQWYTVANKNNVKIEDGLLKIIAQREDYQNKKYTSTRLTTKYKGDWTYGKIEVRAKLPSGNGTWPAIWMMPTDNVYGEWPKSGEIDIMEHVGSDPDRVLSTSHTEAFNHIIGNQETKNYDLPTATSKFHVFSLEWDENEWRSYVDGNLYFSYRKQGDDYKVWPYNQRFHIILNLAVGGGLGGTKGINDSLFPHTFEIDYVRVYQNIK